MDVISLRLARHVSPELQKSLIEVKEGGVQVDFQSTHGPGDSIELTKSKEHRMSRAHSSVLLLDNSKSRGGDIHSEGQDVEIEENN